MMRTLILSLFIFLFMLSQVAECQFTTLPRRDHAIKTVERESEEPPALKDIQVKGSSGKPVESVVSLKEGQHWEALMKKMSESYDKTLSSFRMGDVDAARREYTLKFLPAAESFYRETNNSVPAKYEEYEGWGNWAEEYYRLIKQAKEKFDADDLTGVAVLLWEVRLHISDLNIKTNNQTANDYLTLLLKEMSSGKAEIKDIEEGIAELNKSGLGLRARRQSYLYGKDKNEFVKVFNSAVADGELSEEEYNKLNQAVSNLFFKYAAPFE